jgi:ABC-type branched-subunit amino acid transport system substrate-binding protein
LQRHTKRTGVRGAAIAATAVLVMAGCSTGDDDDSADTTEATTDTTEAATDTTEATTDTTEATTDTTEAATDTTEATTDTTEADSGSGEVETGSGVTDDSINLAILTDLTGPFAAGAAIQVDGFNAYWDNVNANGGVCERTIELDIQDHTYDPQTAVSQYQSIADNTLAVQQLLGSPMVAALLPQLEEDGMYVGGMGWASVVLPYNVAQIPGTTYSIEGANAIDYLLENGLIAEGDSVGVIFFQGDYGDDVAAGVGFAAEQNGISVVEQPITPADADLTSQVAALAQEGVTAVVLGGSPGTLGGYVNAALNSGLTVPVVGANPVFNPSLLDTPAGDYLVENYISITSVSPVASDDPGPTEALALYTAAGGSETGWEIPLAYGQALLLHAALDAACDAGQLTREGVVTAMRETTGLNTDGVFPDGLDYTTIGEPPTRTVFIATVDRDVEGGLAPAGTYEGPSAAAYTFG